MLYTQTDKIKISTVGASFTVTFSVAPDEIGFLTVLHKMYSEMNMSGLTIKPNLSEKPNSSTISKMEQVGDDAYFLELMGAVERGEISDAGANQAWYEYINHKDEPQTDCSWK